MKTHQWNRVERRQGLALLCASRAVVHLNTFNAEIGIAQNRNRVNIAGPYEALNLQLFLYYFKTSQLKSLQCTGPLLPNIAP